MGKEYNTDSDGYYQDVDEARFSQLDEDEKFDKKRTIKRRNEASYKDPKYGEIAEKHNPQSRNGRRRFCAERHEYHAQKNKISEQEFNDGKFDNIKPSEVVCKCKNCKSYFVAKKADRKRGWAIFCSKSCKAQSF